MSEGALVKPYKVIVWREYYELGDLYIRLGSRILHAGALRNRQQTVS
jgi:hypothetical protein